MGFDSTITLKKLTSDNIASIEKAASDIPNKIRNFIELMKLNVHEKLIDDVNELMLGPTSQQVVSNAPFKFSTEDHVLISAIIELLKSNYSRLFQIPNSTPSNTMITFIGEIFSKNEVLPYFKMKADFFKAN